MPRPPCAKLNAAEKKTKRKNKKSAERNRAIDAKRTPIKHPKAGYNPAKSTPKTRETIHRTRKIVHKTTEKLSRKEIPNSARKRARAEKNAARPQNRRAWMPHTPRSHPRPIHVGPVFFYHHHRFPSSFLAAFKPRGRRGINAQHFEALARPPRASARRRAPGRPPARRARRSSSLPAPSGCPFATRPASAALRLLSQPGAGARLRSFLPPARLRALALLVSPGANVAPRARCRPRAEYRPRAPPRAWSSRGIPRAPAPGRAPWRPPARSSRRSSSRTSPPGCPFATAAAYAALGVSSVVAPCPGSWCLRPTVPASRRLHHHRRRQSRPTRPPAARSTAPLRVPCCPIFKAFSSTNSRIRFFCPPSSCSRVRAPFSFPLPAFRPCCARARPC